MLFPVAVPVRRDDVHILYDMDPIKSKKTETAYVNFQTKNSREVQDTEHLEEMLTKYVPMRVPYTK